MLRDGDDDGLTDMTTPLPPTIAYLCLRVPSFNPVGTWIPPPSGEVNGVSGMVARCYTFLLLVPNLSSSPLWIATAARLSVELWCG